MLDIEKRSIFSILGLKKPNDELKTLIIHTMCTVVARWASYDNKLSDIWFLTIVDRSVLCYHHTSVSLSICTCQNDLDVV